MSIQWVPSHVGVAGHEAADCQAAKRAKVARVEVVKHKQTVDVWAELGLQEMSLESDCSECSDNDSGGSGTTSSDSDGEHHWILDKRSELG